jgi:hypothetical protein
VAREREILVVAGSLRRLESGCGIAGGCHTLRFGGQQLNLLPEQVRDYRVLSGTEALFTPRVN